MHAPSHPSYFPESQSHAISHVHGEPKGGGEIPEMLLFWLVLVVLADPTLPAQVAADDGGGGAELEEGGRDLERERDAGEGVRRIM